MTTLTKERQQNIDEMIGNIWKETGLYYPKDNLIDIVERLGVKVFYLDFSDYKEANRGINGLIKWTPSDKETKAEIYINKNYSSERKKLLLAHELGHFILHLNKEKLRIDCYGYSEDSQESSDENEANYFTENLLMPMLFLARQLTRKLNR